MSWVVGLVLLVGFGWWGTWLIAQLDWRRPSGVHLMCVPLLHEQWRGRYGGGHASPAVAHPLPSPLPLFFLVVGGALMGLLSRVTVMSVVVVRSL